MKNCELPERQNYRVSTWLRYWKSQFSRLRCQVWVPLLLAPPLGHPALWSLMCYQHRSSNYRWLDQRLWEEGSICLCGPSGISYRNYWDLQSFVYLTQLFFIEFLIASADFGTFLLEVPGDRWCWRWTIPIPMRRYLRSRFEYILSYKIFSFIFF